jgi:hypothetical protein
MLKIIKNTYPKDGIGKHKTGTFCKWRIEKGHLLLSVVDEKGNFVRNGLMYENIFSHGQIYALNGNLLSGKKEPERIGLVAKFVKNGFFLELEETY